jgi:opacity protein-like surface antigen
VAAQARRPVTVGIAVGASVPVSDFADDVKAGAHAMALLQYEPAQGIWGVRGEFSYHRSDYTDEFLLDVGALPDDELHNAVSHLGATALLVGARRDGAMTPYLLGGLGAYRLTVSRTSGSSSLSESENGFGFNGGAGVRFGRNAGFFIEARYHQFSITPEAGPGELEVKSTYRMIPVTIGVRF